MIYEKDNFHEIVNIFVEKRLTTFPSFAQLLVQITATYDTEIDDNRSDRKASHFKEGKLRRFHFRAYLSRRSIFPAPIAPRAYPRMTTFSNHVVDKTAPTWLGDTARKRVESKHRNRKHK